ncbi:MAG: 50S ribosomal protein L23 [Berkelbacteria bacterium GW2011_GWA2_38_9]|uniref:Large ribosomal subunit protein uL23 n=1 Tax=Berkelbacteria bacterium GW2011_GWA2_38_9 TaxID=1618334 RepID=A0A0G0LFY4_9BACT|nr:MAG: 50S ribosomal protein L23 [Berkelbacteria bacterium GW2011_GWA2_38_9]
MKLTPVITEKSYRHAAGDKKKSRLFTFSVDPTQNKFQIVKEIEKIFGVNVLKSQILNRRGKIKKFKNIFGKTSLDKRIIVKLKPGQSISAFELEETNKEAKKDK